MNTIVTAQAGNVSKLSKLLGSLYPTDGKTDWLSRLKRMLIWIAIFALIGAIVGGLMALTGGAAGPALMSAILQAAIEGALEGLIFTTLSEVAGPKQAAVATTNIGQTVSGRYPVSQISIEQLESELKARKQIIGLKR